MPSERTRPSTIVSAIVLVLGVSLAGCPSDDGQDGENDSSGDDPVALVEMPNWVRVVDPSQDAFADQRPVDAVCDDAGYYVDPFSQALEIQTDVCDYLTLSQPTLVALEPGDVVTVFGLHDALTADEPAQGYLALAFAGEIEWELFVAIPNPQPELIEESFTIDRSIPAGTELQFHLHNHGPNTWELAAVLVTPAE